MNTLPQSIEGCANVNSPVKVWLVDDNARFRNLVAELLGEIKGIQCVRHFSSPTELLSTLASKVGPDVILLDIQMGNENGLDAVRPIKSLARSTRVLMFTTCFDPELRERALSDGASDFLMKGGPLDKLITSILQPDDPAKVCASRRRRPQRNAASEIVSQNVSATPGNTFSRGINFIRALWN